MMQFTKLFLLLCPTFALAQTNLSGVINDYARVLGVEPCVAQLTVDDASGFSPGEAILILQMQGLVVADDNDSDFGTVQPAASVPNFWERAEVLSIDGNVLSLAAIPANDIDPDLTIQVVSYPTFADATVVGPLLAQPWDGSTGGVLAFQISGTLTLEADLDVTGAGFRGGALEIVDASGCTFPSFLKDDYFFNNNTARGALKGESAAIFTTDREDGRGHWAGGGGGGNDHNAGGGGGGNFGIGGVGGEHTNDSFFGCRGEFPGIGGDALADYGRYPGSGGGAGHADNTGAGSPGGNGGGIVILDANQIVVPAGTERFIHADGAAATSAAGDGGGGGGAGGVVMVRAGQTSGSLIVTANGGDGGNAIALSDRCFGPGGGGGGGLVQFTPVSGYSAIEVNGSAPGLVDNPTAACDDTANGAIGGLAGSLGPNVFDLDQGTDVPQAFAITQGVPPLTNLCPGGGVIFSVGTSNSGDPLTFQWQEFTGGAWQDLVNNANFDGVQTTELSLTNVPTTVDGLLIRLLVTGCDGSTVTTETQINLIDIPDPTLTATDNDALTYTFNITDTGGYAFTVDFGDGNSVDDDPNPTHTYDAPGTYTVSVQILTPCGPVVVEETITVDAAVIAPTAAFTFSSTEGCAPLEVTFQNNTTGTGPTYQWTFSAGTPATSTAANPTVTFATAGNVTAELTATNAAGTDVSTQTLVIDLTSAPAEPEFSATPNALTVNFAIDAPQPGVTYDWTFGDGNVGSGPTPVHTYAAAGSYPVMVTATNDCGTESLIELVVVEETMVAPTAAFTFGDTEGCAPLEVAFENLSAGTGNTYSWTFQNGTPATSTAANPTVTYTSSGTYSVELTATNAGGSDVVTQSVLVSVQTAPSAPSFTTLPSSLTVGFQVNSPQAGVDYAWTFGDGEVGTGTSPTHTYAAAGNYAVVLTATNDCGSETFTQTVTVQEVVMAPTASFTFSDPSGCAPVTIDFQNTSTGDGVSYAWTFENGTPATSTQENPTVTFNSSGMNTVTLTATNAGGTVTATQVLTVVVGQLPADPFVNLTPNGLALTYSIGNQTAGQDYFWDFGDTNTATGASGTHVYDAPGNYTLTLTITNNCGDNVTVLPDVVVQQIQTVNLSANLPAGCAPLLVTFSNLSSPVAGVLEWEFEGGTPGTSTAAAPQVLYEEPGTYDVTLTVDGVNGPQSVTLEDYITLEQQPVVDFQVFLDGAVLQTQNLSQFADTYVWNFGDGSDPVAAFEPTHTYTQNGTFDVNLIAQNSFCGSGATIPILIDGVVDTDDPGAAALQLRLFPNPTADWLHLRAERPLTGGRMMTADGQVLTELLPGTDRLAVSRLATGVYWLELWFGDVRTVRRVVVQR